MRDVNKITVAIIVGAIVIGGCIFGAIVYTAPKNPRTPVTSTENAIVKNASTAEALQKVPAATCQVSTNTIVTKVIDGDTLIVEGGVHVRLIGIDADEKNYSCYDAAKVGLETLVLGKQVRLEKDVTDVDQYGRCLRTVFLGSQNVDVQMVKEGLAVARFYPPDGKYKSEISLAEKEAIQNNVGCKWANK